MQVYNTQNNYGIISRFLHWIMAIIIIALFIVGKIMIDLDYYDPNYHVFPWWHKSFGLVIALMLFFRILWKTNNPSVVAIDTGRPYELKAAKLAHALLYLLILICCISGVMISTAEGAGIEFFGWFEIPSFLSKGEPQAELAGKVHNFATWSLIILASIHLLAALKHHFIEKNDTLRRMIFINKKDNL